MPRRTLHKAPQFLSTLHGLPRLLYGRGTAFSSAPGQGLASQSLRCKGYFPSQPYPPLQATRGSPASEVAVIHDLHLLPALCSQGERGDIALATDRNASESDTAGVLDVIRACTNHRLYVCEIVSL